MGMNFTPDQELAVLTKNRPLLVSAAAGSGKTRVLVERLMHYVTADEEKTDINRFLIITFTRAAAAELRSRVMDTLNDLLREDPTNTYLRRQTELLCRADISTIDSLCGRLLRENVQYTRLPPDFRVIEEEKSEAVKNAVLKELMEDIYKNIEEHPENKLLIDSVGAGKDDSRLSELLLQLHKTLQSHPDPDEWIEKCRLAMSKEYEDAGDTHWGAFLLTQTERRAAFWAQQLEKKLEELYTRGGEKLRKNMCPALENDASHLRAVQEACRDHKWDRTKSALQWDYMRFGGSKIDPEDEALREIVKVVRKECKNAIEKLRTSIPGTSTVLLQELKESYPVADALLTLCRRFDKAYAREKREQGYVDFSDQEHMVLKMLRGQAVEEGCPPAPDSLRRELSHRWREVMVDEYQDINRCQEELFRAMSDNGKNLFTVGDVKQSIYRFRLGDPGIFLERNTNAVMVRDSLLSSSLGLITLRENFRSLDAVLDATNSVFESILSPVLGEMEYDENAHLVRGLEQPQEPMPRACLSIVDTSLAEKENGYIKSEEEAKVVAQKIQYLMNKKTQVHLYDKGKVSGSRDLTYGDIAILMRGKKASAVFQRILTEQGIPVVSPQGSGYFQSAEIAVMLSLLKVIDNPRQDIPLISVLCSPLYGFSPDDLAAVRGESRKSDFYRCLLKAAESNKNCADFIQELDYYRVLSPEISVEELLRVIFNRSNAFALVSALPNGELRRENLERLLEYARTYEQGGYRGLSGFIRKMSHLEEEGEESAADGACVGNAVQIMTIHRSKGLEFPVVFLSDLSHGFNAKDSSKTVLVHPAFQLGCKVIDPERALEYPSLAHRAIAEKIRQETISEEMRVLYVGMTRAREYLFMTCVMDDVEKTRSAMEIMEDSTQRAISPELLEKDGCFAKWLFRCAIKDPQNLELEITEPVSAAAERESQALQSENTDIHIEPIVLTWEYPFKGTEKLPSKITASDHRLSIQAEEETEDAQLVPFDHYDIRRPVFLNREKEMTAAEKGTAMHLALRLISYDHTDSLESIESEIHRMVSEKYMTERQADSIDAEQLLRFFVSPLGQRILHADNVYREQKFTLLLDSSTLDPNASGEEILLQGVVDCCIEEGGQLTIIDYKTDRVDGKDIAERTAYYASQLRFYAEAMRRIHRKSVREAHLFFLKPGIASEVKL